MVNLRTKKILSSMLVASMITFGMGLTITDTFNVANANTTQIQPLRGKIVSVPIGTAIPTTATMELSSENLVQGQSVTATLSSNFYYDNALIAPLGSSMNGTVIQAKKAGRAGKNGQLMIKFTSIVTPYGQMIPISAKIQTDDGTGLLKGGTKMETAKDYAKDIAIGAASGAVAGVAMGPLAGGKAGKGAVYGTAIGAGLGLAKSFIDKGEPAIIPVGTVMNVVLDQQATFTQQQGYQY